MRKIKLTVHTGYVGADHEDYTGLPEDWDDWSEHEQDKFLEEERLEFLYSCCESYAEVVDDE